MIVFQIDIVHILAFDAEGEAIVSGHPNAPFAAAASFKRMQFPARILSRVPDISRLINGVKNYRKLCCQIRANTASIASFVKTP
jgi:hypothetical protein